ncbi:MAG: wax ester/triacylglycerol synthase family O-acyltransferase [Acidimicrobiales bacterium]
MSADRELRNDRRMTDVEALMWNLEKDPHLSASIANVTVFDQAPDPERLRARLERAVVMVPRLRQKVVPALGRLAPPEWRDDPDFDLDYHLRWLALPAPGTMRQLLDMAAAIVHDPFDRTRPLWEFVVIEGLDGDGAAMVQKLHHAITDGEGGIRMSEQFIDLSPDATEPIAPDRPPPASPLPASLLDTTVDTLTHRLRRTAGAARRAVGGGVDLVQDPARVAALGGDVVEMGRSALRQLVVSDRAHSPVWTDRSLRRRVEVLQVPLAEAKAAAKELGGSLNDLFVAAAAGGAGAYHRAAGAPVDELRITMPVSTRRDGSAGGNAFTPTRALLPVGLDDPVALFTAVRERLTVSRTERSLGIVDGLAGVANLLPTSVAVRVARQQVETVDFATSNVRGAPFPLFIAGARIMANYPIGPTGGTAWNLTLMSYDGSLDMGLNADLAAVPDPDVLRDLIAEQFAALIAAGSPTPRRRRKPSS